MRTEEYLQLLYEGKKDEAEAVRSSTIPNKLIKFIWLDGSKDDKKKFLSLKMNTIWFSAKDALNDPFEYRGMLLDKKKLQEAGYSTDVIDTYQTLFDFNDYGLACFSANDIDYLPMWAYYTNNHQGFCIEYEVIKKNCIHEVLYEPERIKIASLILQMKEAVKKAIKLGGSNEAEFYSTLLLQNLFIKDCSWAHEQEYRIAYPIDNQTGINVPVWKLGMKTNKIIAGIKCSKESIMHLNEISNELGLGDVYKSELHPDKYTIQITRY